MKAILVTKKSVLNIKLPEKIYNNYWITYNNQKIVKISEKRGKLEISSNIYAKIIDPKHIKIKNHKINISNTNENIYVDKTIIKENKMYAIYVNSTENDIYLFYCTNEDCNSFNHYEIINTNKITIGSNENNNIVYKKVCVSNFHAEIYKKDDKSWYIKNFDKNYGTFVNNIPIYDNEKKLFNGDIVFIMGLKFILINDYIYINTPNIKLVLDNKYFKKKKNEKINLTQENEDNDIQLEVNKKENYFFRGPRLTALVKKEKLKIDPPPDGKKAQEKPMFLVIGSSLAMGIIMILSLSSTIKSIINGTATLVDTIISFFTAFAMLIAMILIPILNIKYDKKMNEKYLQKRQNRYREYLNKKREIVNSIKEKHKELLFKNYSSVNDCVQIITSNNHRLWERKINDSDFLSIRIGIGDVPLEIDIIFPEEEFSMEDDELLEEAKEVVKEAKYIDNSPLILSLVEKNISGIMCQDLDFLNKYIKNIIAQLICFQSYGDLKLIFLLNKNVYPNWQYVKMLPHVWDDTNQIRFFADNYNDMREISTYLNEKFKNRLNTSKGESNYKENSPYYLIITDDYKSLQNLEIIQNICKTEQNLGFSLLCLTDNFYELPNECKIFVEINQDSGKIFDNESLDDEQKIFKIEPIKIIFYEEITQKLANIPIMVQSTDVSSLPKNYTFLEMYNVENIEQLRIEERWMKNDTTLSLSAPIGIDNKQNIISLDIHEKFHGPHGLIAGSTGSGKSEFIMTYILSLAINYHPNDVTFLLIDYKGGGLAGAFHKGNIQLPHLVGIITNIDRNQLQRSLSSIQSELRKRQILFNEARSATNEGTIDIYKYQRLYHNGIVKIPISHLFIICDEFAELKQQQPDFMEELMSVSRIGRSLGVHLILATQKPAGIVNDQIRSNSKFAICLKVQDTYDSQDVINTPDAAYLKNPGQFYMKVGNNEYYILGQSGWAGAQYIPNKITKKNNDNSIEIISNIGSPIKRIEDSNIKITTNR